MRGKKFEVGAAWAKALALSVAMGIGGLSVAAPAAAQALPHVTGVVEVGLDTGSIAGNICLSRIPLDGDTITLVLNESLSVDGITGASFPAVSEEVEPGGGTVRISFAGAQRRLDPTSGQLVADACLTYRGVFPIHDIAAGSFRAEDAANVIAFNGRAVRARGVSRWYPTAFARDRGVGLEAVTYDLDVVCSACNVIYINGGRPSAGPTAAFRSDIPRELLLVAGDLPIIDSEHGTIFGEAVAADTAAIFLSRLTEIRHFLEQYLEVPFDEPPLVVRLDAVQRPRTGAIWGFFSDPSLTLIGMDIGGFVRILEGSPSSARRSIVGFLAHELAHRYFGWTVGAASSQRDLFGEPFATYLELKTLRHFLGENDYRFAVRRLRESAGRLAEPVPVRLASPNDLAVSAYRYAYVPLALLALEHSIGEATMRRTLRMLIEAPPERRYAADFEFIVETAAAAGASSESLAYWRDVCLARPVAENPCMERIGESR